MTPRQKRFTSRAFSPFPEFATSQIQLLCQCKIRARNGCHLVVPCQVAVLEHWYFGAILFFHPRTILYRWECQRLGRCVSGG